MRWSLRSLRIGPSIILSGVSGNITLSFTAVTCHVLSHCFWPHAIWKFTATVFRSHHASLLMSIAILAIRWCELGTRKCLIIRQTKNHGFHSRRFCDGISEWQRQGGSPASLTACMRCKYYEFWPPHKNLVQGWWLWLPPGPGILNPRMYSSTYQVPQTVAVIHGVILHEWDKRSAVFPQLGIVQALNDRCCNYKFGLHDFIPHQ